MDMPTLDGDERGPETDVGLLATHFGGKVPLCERVRRARLREQMFGDAGGQLTLGRYTITQELGSGAMGTVYRATDESLDREVAVKVLHRSDEMHRARMTTEAKALARLSHPNVVTVHEVGTEDEQLFVAMEFVAGKTLQTWLEQPHGMGILEAFRQAAEGLHAAHTAGIVHRDFKPENVIIGDDGRVRVLDFGMARSSSTPLLQDVDVEEQALQASEPAITRTGILAGTPSYMAPEQFEGGRVDARADQFAFCIALHEAIWGVRPFEGQNVATLARSVLGGHAELFGGTPRAELSEPEVAAAKAVIERGLKNRPEDRFGSMREVSERLRGTPVLVPRLSRARRRVAIVSGAAAVIGVGVGMFGLRPLGESERPAGVVTEPGPTAEVSLARVPGELPAVSGHPSIHVGRTHLEFDSMQLAPVNGGEIDPSKMQGHLVLPLYDHLSEWVMKDEGWPGSSRRLAVHADASTPFGELVDVLYTSGRAGFTAYELVAETAAGTQGALRVTPPIFPTADGQRPPLKVMVLHEGFRVSGPSGHELIARLDGKDGLAGYDFTALSREAASHNHEQASTRAVVSASADIRHDVIVRTLATLRGDECSSDPAQCLMTHLSLEAGSEDPRE